MEFRNCNNFIEDGCEINISDDPANCGACGNACAAGVHCIDGKCGCLPPLTDCDGKCRDTRYDENNCGACRNECGTSPTDCDPKRPNTDYGCGESACGKVQCKGGFGDCNHDLNTAYSDKGCLSDGCETDLRTDTNNCGSCGVKCAPGQECRDDGDGPQCLEPCAKANLTQCQFGCVDLLSDKSNCGMCGNMCPFPRAHQVSSCAKGFCKMECLAGFGDCNGDPSDGCEVDLSRHPANCGSCGHACDADAGAGSDGGAGQPCIEGTCLMVECGPTGETH
jgi:hypothetical protein